MSIKIEYQDLFLIESSYHLAHCISLDAAMGAGVAKQFVSRFPHLREQVRDCVCQHRLQVPQVVAVPYNLEGTDEVRWVFNLITKERYFQKPTLQTVEATLWQLKGFCESYRLQKIAMPQIASGLDRLNWIEVLAVIERIFGSSSIEVLICIKPD